MAYLITNVCNRTGQIEQFLKQPIKPYIRAVNNQSCSSILLLTQLLLSLLLSYYFYDIEIENTEGGIYRYRMEIVIIVTVYIYNRVPVKIISRWAVVSCDRLNKSQLIINKIFR